MGYTDIGDDGSVQGKTKISNVNVVTFKEPGTNEDQGSLLSVYLFHFTNITLLNDV